MSDLSKKITFDYDIEDYISHCRQEIISVKDLISKYDAKLEKIDKQSAINKIIHYAKNKQDREQALLRREELQMRCDSLEEELNFYLKNGLNLSRVEDKEKFKEIIKNRTQKLDMVSMAEMGMI